MKNGTILMTTVLLAAFAGMAAAGWLPQTSGVNSTLYDIECSGPNQVWAVGAGGRIVHTTDAGAHWAEQTSGTGSDLYGVDFVDSLNGWATGSGPVILHTTNGGAAWSPQSAGVSDDLMDVAFGSATRGWCSGVNGAIIGTTNGGATWAREISGIWGWYWGITAGSATEAWTVGGDWFNHVSPIYHYNGSSWSKQYDITRNQNGQDISVTAGNILWAIADSGTISHSTNGGTSWTTQNSGTTVMLSGVNALSANYCWIVGAGGLILRTANGGAGWVSDTSGVTNDLFGIVMLDSTVGWACGAGGKILYRNGAQGIEETMSDKRGAMSPVPTMVRNRLMLPAFLLPAPCSLLAPNGRKVMELRAGANDVRGLVPGAYVVAVSEHGRLGTFRFVKVD